MDIEQIREAVAEEHAHGATENADGPTMGEVNHSHGPARALSIDVIESMCATARAEGWRDGFQRGVADAMQRRQVAEKWAGRRGETAGLVAGLSYGIGAAERVAEQGGGPMLLRAAMAEMLTLQHEVRENGLHGEREF